MKTYKKTTTTTENRLEISQDYEPMNTREDDNLGYFITSDRNYNSPDRNEELERIVKEMGDIAKDQKDHIKLIKEEIEGTSDEKVLKIYPITKYEHSGVAYSLGNLRGFDYSANGFYIITQNSADNIGLEKTPKNWEKVIEGELELYNKYINGDYYQFFLYDKDGEMIDNCSNIAEIEDIRDYLPEEWKDEDLIDYLIN